MSRTSFILAIVLFLHSHYFAVFVFLELCLGIFKAVTLPFQNINLVMEFLIILFLAFTELVRIYLGCIGNLTEALVHLILSAILTGPAVLAVLYLLFWQTYVLWLEIVFCYVQISMQGLEFILSLVSVGTIYKYTAY